MSTKRNQQSTLSFSQCVDGFLLTAAARGLSDHTLADYQNTFRLFILHLKDDVAISSIASKQVEVFLAAHTERVSNKTLLNYHTGLSALWSWAVNQKLAKENIVRLVPPPKPEIRKIVPFTEQEAKLLLGALERSKAYSRPGKRVSDHALQGAERNRLIILLLLDCGMRASELCQLQLQHVDVRNHRVMVLGKGAKERILPFSSRTGGVLWRYLAQIPGLEQTSPIFTTSVGYPLDGNQLRRILARIGDRAKVADVHPHRFRHTFAIQFLRNGGDPYTLQMLLGHSTMDMVRRYLDLAQTDLERAHKRASPVDNWRL